MKYPIFPVAKPRMTRRDKWRQRPCVMKYRAFKDECRLHGIYIPQAGAHIIFHVPMPKSWPKKKRIESCGKAHRQRPDIDNYCKALLDAIYEEDSGVWDIRITKVWSETGAIEVRNLD